MSSKFRIHGRIAAAPRHTMPASVVDARHAMVRRDMASRALYWSHVAAIGAAIGAAIVVGIIGAIVI